MFMELLKSELLDNQNRIKPKSVASESGLAWAVAVGVVLGMFAGLFLLLSVHCIQRAIYSTANPTPDEMTSPSEERYSFWRESNRYSGYQTAAAAAQVLMASQQQQQLQLQQQQQRLETSVQLAGYHRRHWLLSCARCCRHDSKDVVSVKTGQQELSSYDVHCTDSQASDSSSEKKPRRGRKIARLTVDCNNSGAWRPENMNSSQDTWQHQFKSNIDEQTSSPKKSLWTGVDARQMVMLDYRPGLNSVCIHRPAVELQSLDSTTWRPVDLLPNSND